MRKTLKQKYSTFNHTCLYNNSRLSHESSQKIRDKINSPYLNLTKITASKWFQKHNTRAPSSQCLQHVPIPLLGRKKMKFKLSFTHDCSNIINEKH